MKLRNYVVLMAICVVAMVIMTVTPCGADWYHVYSDVSSGPNSDYDYDSDSGTGWSLEWEDGYYITDPDRSADSSGCEASANCTAYSSGQVMGWNGGYAYISPNRGCAVWGNSYYADDDPPSDPLPVSWSIEGSGTVSVGGGVYDDSLGVSDTAYSNANASGGIDSHESGYGWAWGSVEEYEYGQAEVFLDGHAVEDSNDVYDGEDGWYSATLYFSIEGGDNEAVGGTMYGAEAEVWAWTSCYAGISTSSGKSGEATVGAAAEFDGTASVEVSL